MSETNSNLIGGVEKRQIRIVDYDTNWSSVFEHHALSISTALGSTALQIEHVGSTSVEGLGAKPIVDILLVVQNSAEESSYLPQLESAGYMLRVREPDFFEHRMFRTSDRAVHLHVYSAGSPEAERMLRFRDRLRADAGDRERYERTKRDLASRDWSDMNAYSDAKSAVIEEILSRG